MINTWKRKALALMSVPLLAIPSAVGVYTFLSPTSGPVAAALAACGFELLYIGVNILVIASDELRRYARNVSLCAVATAVLMNTIAHYTSDTFDLLRLGVAIVASLPLATLAYAVSVLLHRLSETDMRRAATTQEAAQARDQLVTARAELADMAAQLASRDAMLASATMDSAGLREVLASHEREARKLRDENAKLRERPPIVREPPPTQARIVAYVQGQLASGSRSLLDISRELGISESTVRGWLKVAANGHAIKT
jgi:hypothetical protein